MAELSTAFMPDTVYEHCSPTFREDVREIPSTPSTRPPSSSASWSKPSPVSDSKQVRDETRSVL